MITAKYFGVTTAVAMLSFPNFTPMRREPVGRLKGYCVMGFRLRGNDRGSFSVFFARVVVACVLALTFATPAHTQNYPVKPLRFVVGFAPGGGTDFVARIIAQKLTDAVGQQVIVENRPGAGGLTGLEYALRAAPDGYTFTVVTPGYGILPSLYPVKYDPLTDYTPVVHIARGP